MLQSILQQFVYFIPKLQDKTHEKWMSIFLNDKGLLERLVHIQETEGFPTKDEGVYVTALKRLYTRT
ncbi:hypothetical protein DPMN_109312 [Dreissena polymorpha]|uniref:Uncharacterized protein n=1 Tax=Dreissena polymorpha TaxID=45954 RepID=A0A9D4KA25_DREPO|nr:hypothetical protein DPMN_109312 [Dreissena polymorpha]